jgi:hypothetical protein
VSEEDYSYSYSNNAVRENAIYAFLHVDQLGAEVDLDRITINSLKNK